MSTVNTPTINRIQRMTEYDQLRTAITQGNMYLCTDSLVMYYDESSTERSVYSYVGIKTVNDLIYNTVGDYGTSYYCWEDNSLWIWMNKWIVLWSDSTYPSAYVYYDIPTVNDPQILSGVYNADNVLDNNGLLKDGSVVIRDSNRIIKGKLYINDTNDNLVISSYLGGAIRLLPNGHLSTDGEMLIGDEGESFLRSNFSLMGGEYYVDYTDNPEDDENEYANSTHKYLVYHEGNLDTSAILTMTAEEILNKLNDGTLETPLDLNVKYLNGYEIDDISLVGHTHTSSDISDFNEKAQAQANIVIKQVMNNLGGDGITVSANSSSSIYKLSADSFTLTLSGGVIGSGEISHLTDTTISTTVDPDAHIHTDYVTRMDDLQSQINEINAMDPNNYYTTTQVDTLIANAQGTEESTVGKAVIVSSDGTLHATTTAATQLSEKRTITFEGDVTGVLITDFSEDTSVELNAEAIVSTVPTSGKALLVNSNLDLPGNAETASSLNHIITLNVTNEATGSVEIDTQEDEVELQLTLNPGDNIVTVDDLIDNGGNVVTLNENNLIDSQYLSIGRGLIYLGTFNPDDGIPDTEDLQDGDFYVAANNGTLVMEVIIETKTEDDEGNIEIIETTTTKEVTFYTNDWLLYLNGMWQRVSFQAEVSSVNEKTGDVVLTADDVGAISSTLIDYNTGDPVPQGYVVTATETGRISGTTVDSLSEEFSLLTSSSVSEIVIDTDNSNNTSTDGSQDLDVNLKISDVGYEAILDNAAHEIIYNGDTLNHTRYLDFSDGFTITVEDNVSIITASGSSTSYDIITIDGSNTDSDYTSEICSRLTNMWAQKDTNPFIIAYIPSTSGSRAPEEIIYFAVGSKTESIGDSSIIITAVDTSDFYKITGDDNFISIYSYTNASIQFDSSDGETITSYTYYTYGAGDLGQVLSTTGGSDDDIFIPEYSWQPATKEYVDTELAAISAGLSSRFTATFGDGTSTEFVIEHNLERQDVIVQFREVATGEQVFVSNIITDENTITVTTSTPPSQDQYMIIVM